MSIPADQVKKLREITGVGFMECKGALEESKGDLELAVTILRKKGLASLAKKAGRETKEGLIGSYVHNGKIGVMVEVNCESDFVARNTDFQTLVKDIAMHIAASDPRFIRKEDVTEDVLAKEREIYKEQARSTGKPDIVLDKIVEGRMVEILFRDLPARAAVRARPQRQRQGPHRCPCAEDRRKHPGAPVHALQTGRLTHPGP